MEEIIKIEPKLYARAYQICKDEHKAKDAVQETFLWAIENDIYDTTNAMNMLVKLALKQLNYKEVFIPSGGNDEEYESETSGYARKFETKTAVNATEVTERLTLQSIDPSLLIKKKNVPKSGTFLNYKAAVAYMSTTGITTMKEFTRWSKSQRPSFIPSRPWKYFEKEYTTIHDFLGISKFLTYEEALTWTKENCERLKIMSQATWFGNKDLLPSKMPICPQNNYKNKGWVNWATFLHKDVSERQLNRYHKNFHSYKDAKQWVKDNLVPKGINTGAKFMKGIKTLPTFIPSHPETVYRDKGWTNWSEFFDNGKYEFQKEHFSEKEFWDYKKSREWVRLNLRLEGVTNETKWREYVKNPTNLPVPVGIPRAPKSSYQARGIWVSWNDFLGTINRTGTYKEYPNFLKLREWLRENMVGRKITKLDWAKWRKGEFKDNPYWPTPPFPLPSDPESKYEKEWKGWKQLTLFKNKNNQPIKGLSKSTCTIQNAILKGTFNAEVLGFSRRKVASILNMLKRRGINHNILLSYPEAGKYVQDVLVPKGIDNFVKYTKHLKTKDSELFLPTNPHKIYKDKGWVDMRTFFGRDFISPLEISKFRRREAIKLPFNEARQWVRDNLVPLGINSLASFKKYDNLPVFIPQCPHVYYKKEWMGWPDWFGREMIPLCERNKKIFLPYHEAQGILEAANITNVKLYRKTYKSIHDKLPSDPKAVYKKEWKGWLNFFNVE